jgi:hypothetical protein
MVPHDLPPWAVIYQRAQQWILWPTGSKQDGVYTALYESSIFGARLGTDVDPNEDHR